MRKAGMRKAGMKSDKAGMRNGEEGQAWVEARNE
jgi:hypothetical protein